MLETVTTDLRDVVLLTHPRNLDEPDVRAAARRVRPGVRLFAMSLDRHGSAALHEMRHGSPISIRQFHVDLSRVPVYEDDQVAETRQRPAGNWTGDVEPIGFPFLFGVDGKVTALDFDLGSRHLLTACRQGVLHLWEVGGSLVEMLPRAWYQEGPVTEVLTIVGVHGGFVVRAERGRRCLAVHYDLAKRRCKVHAMEECTVAFAAGAYSPAHDCYIVQRFDKSGESIDLGTGERFSTKLEETPAGPRTPGRPGSGTRCRDATLRSVNPCTCRQRRRRGKLPWTESNPRGNRSCRWTTASLSLLERR